MLYILDTDHISLLQRHNLQVQINLSQVPFANRAITVVSIAEQMQGWQAYIRKVKTEQQAAFGFRQLQVATQFYNSIKVLEYSLEASYLFDKLRQEKIRIGTQDLRIASITLHHNATLVTRNFKDFRKVPNLQIVDWSAIQA